MKSSYLPHAMLAALLLAAALTLFAGVRMAREERVVRTEVGREEIGDFSAEMLGQLGRLDLLYEGHLRRLAAMDLTDRFALRRACEEVVGVRQIAVAVDVESGAKDISFQLDFESGYRGVPMLPGQGEPALGGDFYALPGEEMGLVDEGFGWVDRAGMPLMFWRRVEFGVYVVVTPDLEAVEAAVDGWLREWVTEVVEPLSASGAEVVLSGGGGVVFDVATESHHYVGADVVVPLRSRFGAWKLSAWDTRETVVDYHLPTLVGAVGGAGVFVLIGIGGFVVLRRALRLGEQRVSFVNRVSHELRTPLTNILLNNDLAADAVEMGDEMAAAGRLGLVREEAGRLSRLIANVLTFSRSGDESVEVACEVFCLEELVERTLAPFRASLARKGIVLDVEVNEELRALGDLDAAAQVLANLVSNVEKYAGAGRRLRIEGGRCGDSAVFLRVLDGGAGIPVAARERIFEPFVRLSERVDEGVSGTGLGLSIARELALKMGGELVLVESEVGAVFEFRLPVAPGNVLAMEAS